MVGGFNPSEKYESQLGCLVPIYGKKYSKPPANICIYTSISNRAFDPILAEFICGASKLVCILKTQT